MTLPNFLIIGAAKSGTTSLYHYLEQHPQIYVNGKEPGFFAYEGQSVRLGGPEDQERFNRRVVTKRGDYEALFDGITTESAYGEASVCYLYIKDAAQRIQQYIPEVRLIAVLRNPIDRAFSSYLHLRRDGRESMASFAKAVQEEKVRIDANWDYLWHYVQLGFYYKQLKQYYDLFSPSQITVFTFNEFKTNPVWVLQEIFRFLQIDDTFVPNMSLKYNVSGTPHSRIIHTFLAKPNWAKSTIKPLIPLSVRKWLGTKATAWNMNRVKPEMSLATRSYLQRIYRDDILQLQSLIQKDLSTWLEDDAK
jgi:hypothetical protein